MSLTITVTEDFSILDLAELLALDESMTVAFYGENGKHLGTGEVLGVEAESDYILFTRAPRNGMQKLAGRVDSYAVRHVVLGAKA